MFLSRDQRGKKTGTDKVADYGTRAAMTQEDAAGSRGKKREKRQRKGPQVGCGTGLNRAE